MNLAEKHSIYLIGIGGIGMSALARYFHRQGKQVAGYDKTRTLLCEELESEGISIHYQDDISNIPEIFIKEEKKNDILVIITPAVPTDNIELTWFRDHGFDIHKRAVILGEITKNSVTYAVAGTHGKTTISSCLAHLFTSSGQGCHAFLGGITKNYNTNFLTTKNSSTTVVEADEYDRSFLKLTPDYAIITSVDADHLDIYNNIESVTDAFNEFCNVVKNNGKILIKKDSGFKPQTNQVFIATYSLNEEADCFIRNLTLENGRYCFDLITPWGTIEKIRPGVTGKYNVENVVAAASLGLWTGMDKDQIRNGISTFKGVKRRFDLQETNNGYIYIDDYAHHPEEIKAFISSVKEVYPGKKVTGIFQPHLYTRTRDFADEFGKSLSMLDELLLLDIYPAREMPIPGITSTTLMERISIDTKRVCTKEEIMDQISRIKPELLLTMGAGDIDQLVEPIHNIVKEFK